MSLFWIMLLALGAGSLLAIQAGLNAMMSSGLANPFWGALFAVVSGSIIAAPFLLLAGGTAPKLQTVLSLPAWVWLGGACGSAYVFLVILLAPRLGAATTMALVIAGQTLGALLLDHFGLLGFPAHPAGPARIMGATLLIGGAAMIRFF
ncbi:MAG TPA: DMT family transporter [Alphaproteobacteria bacterium]|nr:DMT family transporter [Alphaproteobacteria bacterium]